MRHRLLLLVSIGVLVCISKTLATTRYVDINNAAPSSPYTSWATAATNIQDAVDTANAGDLVLVTNGVYSSGSRSAGTGVLPNRLVVDKAVTVQSVNGPESTAIAGRKASYFTNFPSPHTVFPTNGPNAIRCAYLGSGGQLIGFTLTNGATLGSGAGLVDQTGGGLSIAGNNGKAYNLLLIANDAYFAGGGATGGALYNCILTKNISGAGGGAWAAGLFNCTVVGNSAIDAGGAIVCSLFNSIVYHNSATRSPDQVGSHAVNSCLTGGFSTVNYANITNAPLLIDVAAGNFRLQSNSPCINGGHNIFASSTALDLDGNPRIVSGTVDMGAYEFQGAGSTISYSWLQRYGLPIDGSIDYADSDGDGHNNWQEWRADTIPTNAVSVLRMLTPSNSVGGVRLSWPNVSTRKYWVERASGVGSPVVYTPIATNILGSTYLDTGATNSAAFYYRVGVEPQTF